MSTLEIIECLRDRNYRKFTLLSITHLDAMYTCIHLSQQSDKSSIYHSLTTDVPASQAVRRQKSDGQWVYEKRFSLSPAFSLILTLIDTRKWCCPSSSDTPAKDQTLRASVPKTAAEAPTTDSVQNYIEQDTAHILSSLPPLSPPITRALYNLLLFEYLDIDFRQDDCTMNEKLGVTKIWLP